MASFSQQRNTRKLCSVEFPRAIYRDSFLNHTLWVDPSTDDHTELEDLDDQFAQFHNNVAWIRDTDFTFNLDT